MGSCDRYDPDFLSALNSMHEERNQPSPFEIVYLIPRNIPDISEPELVKNKPVIKNCGPKPERYNKRRRKY